MAHNKYRNPDGQKIGRVERGAGTKTDAIKKMHEQITKQPIRRQPQRPGKEPKAPDRFQSDSIIPKFLRSVNKRLESSWVYQTFKLPGTNYVVRDHRGGRAKGAPENDQDSAFQMKEGKMAEAKQKGYVNYLGSRKVLQPQESKAAAQEIKRILSEFEKLLVERFEKGKSVEKQSPDGKPHFKLKTDAEWKSFFSKFIKRTVWKKADLKMLKSFIFRGLVKLTKGGGTHAMLVGDMAMNDGQIQKFARLKVLSKLMDLLAKMEPGSTLEKQLLKEGLNAEDFRFLALAHKHGDRAIKTGQQATRGMFADQKTEDQVSRHLGFGGKRGKKKGYGGPIRWGEEGGSTGPQAFVPHGFWERQTRGGWPKMPILIVSTVIVLLILAGIFALVKYFS